MITLRSEIKPMMSKTHMTRHSEAEAGASAHHSTAPDPVYPEEPAGGTSTLVDKFLLFTLGK